MRNPFKRNRKEVPNTAHIFSRTVVGTPPINGKYAEYTQSYEITETPINNSTKIK